LTPPGAAWSIDVAQQGRDDVMPSLDTDSPPQERIVREARISWWVLWPKLALGLGGAALALWAVARQDNLGYAIAVAGAILFFWCVGGALVRRIGMKLKLTDRYVIMESGLASRHTSTLMLNRIESIDIDQTVWQRMTGYGTLTIRGMGSEDLRIVGVQDPLGFQADARRVINSASGSSRV